MLTGSRRIKHLGLVRARLLIFSQQVHQLHKPRLKRLPGSSCHNAQLLLTPVLLLTADCGTPLGHNGWRCAMACQESIVCTHQSFCLCGFYACAMSAGVTVTTTCSK